MTLPHVLAMSFWASPFWSMGGYAGYVWPAYAVFLLVLLADFLAPTLRRRRLLRDLRARLMRQTARQSRTAPPLSEPSNKS